MKNNPQLPIVLFIIFGVFWLISSFNPAYRGTWFLENIIVFLCVPIVILSYFKFRLSNLSYILLFILAMLNIMGAHYTYSLTPVGIELSEFFGWERNHYDRIVHFLYAFIATVVFWELFKSFLPKNKIVAGLFIFSIIISFGALYEIGEFVVSVLVRPEMGLSFLGSQGDIWDAQKDMLAHVMGSLLALLFFSRRSFIKKV